MIATAVDEGHQVECWRLQILIEAGYSLALAEQLAPRADVDLHQAVEIVAAGCAHELAAEILL
jgi:hypothetical protein